MRTTRALPTAHPRKPHAKARRGWVASVRSLLTIFYIYIIFNWLIANNLWFNYGFSEWKSWICTNGIWGKDIPKCNHAIRNGERIDSTKVQILK
ncbi:MAG: hypothetical protein RIS64_3424 [Bacteroidota bacterium]